MIYFVIFAVIYIFLIMPPFRKREVKGLYSHRGYHLKDKTIYENTLESFQKSIDYNYGIELDVRLSKDGLVYVYHDPTLKRLFDESTRFADLESSEIDKLFLGQSKIPRFSDVLELVDGQVDLIVELKDGKGYKELSRKVAEYLDAYKGNFVIESFDPRIVLWFRFNKPEYTRGFLVMKAKKYETPKLAKVWINLFLNFLARPDFVAAHKSLFPLSLNLRIYKLMGGKIVSWTIHEGDPDYDDVDAKIFEYFKA